MSGTGIERPAAGGDAAGRNILIVDDDAVLRDSLSEQLQPVSYTHLTLPTNREV